MSARSALGPTPKMRRKFDDAATHAEKRRKRHRRQRFVRWLRKVAGLCASCGDRLPSRGPVTCQSCLTTDKKYKSGIGETLATARFTDELGRPMPLKGTPKMLPVIGPRHDGDDLDWPECEHLPACLRELVLACGAKEAPGASCPRGCSSFTAPGREQAD